MSGPLAGIRVLDLSRLLPGGFCSLLLADYGADVLKVEDTGLGDYIRWAPPQNEGVEPSAASALFLSLNRGKRSLRLDLKVKEGREVLLRLVRDARRPARVVPPRRARPARRRLRAPARGEPAASSTARSPATGRTAPTATAPGHDIDYLARNGLLGLSGERGGPPVPAAGQIADLGGGAQMAAFGILAALHERDRSGEGQLVDVSMTRGAQSWLAMVAARYLADGAVPRRGELELAGGLRLLPHLRAAPTAGSRSARWSRSSGRASARARARGPARAPHRPGRGARELEAIFATRTRAEWAAFDDAHGCCLEPVLRPRRGARRARPRRRRGRPARARRRRCGCSARPSRCRARRRDGTRPGPALGADTDAVLAAAGYGDAAIERSRRGRRRRPRRGARGELPRMSARPGLKMSELADASGVSAGTIKHYLREGLLGDGDGIVRTSRNMAWYPPRVRRADPPDQAAPGGALPAAAADQGAARRPAAAHAARRRRPARQRARPARRARRAHARRGRLRPRRRRRDRRDRALPRRRLRRGARLHGLRHAALPRGAAPLVETRGRGAPRAARATSSPSAPPRSSARAASRCAS